MFSIPSSLVFLLSVRTTISEFVDLSKELNEDEKRNLKNFFVNEATDYEVIHFFMRGTFPEERYDSTSEAEIYEELRSSLRKDFTLLKNFIDEGVIKSVITEVGPITSSGLSSSAIILEYLTTNNFLEELLEASNGSMDLSTFQQATGGQGKTSKFGWQQAKKFPSELYTYLKLQAEKGQIGKLIASIRTHKKGLKQIAIGLVITLGALAAYRIYRNKLRPAAKACKQYTGPEKEYCMRKFKLEALKSQLDTLRTVSSACSSTAEPQKCKNAIDKKIKKVEARISRLSKQV